MKITRLRKEAIKMILARPNILQLNRHQLKDARNLTETDNPDKTMREDLRGKGVPLTDSLL